MSRLRRTIATSDTPAARFARSVYFGLMRFSLPAPRIVSVPILYLFLACRHSYFFLRRVLFAEPLFKAYCSAYGRNVHTDIYLHWIQGKGDIVLGDNVLIDGLCSFSFAARYCDRPIIRIGSNSGVGSGSSFVVAKAITIGNNCRIAGRVAIRDSDGHAVDAAARRRGDPPPDDAVRPVIIHDNVWIGAGVVIGPGVSIGEGSIVSTCSVVVSSVPPYTIVAGNPARKVGVVSQSSDEDQRTVAMEVSSH